jgi:hypothetical protein
LSLLSAEKKYIFIGRGKENDILLRCSIFDSYCGSDSLEDSRYIGKARRQKIGKRNERARNRRRYDIYGDKIYETLISKKYTEGLWL